LERQQTLMRGSTALRSPADVADFLLEKKIALVLLQALH
jgi:hypothetical protein